MKIEKVNDNQIRCTLTKEDLASRQLKISELAYGTEKAKNLFRDMMQQAKNEFGFVGEDIPLMIEAVPMGAESIVLIITKVEDPEELDTRFSRFAPSVHEDIHLEDDDDSDESSDEILDLFQKLQASGTTEDTNMMQTTETSEDKPLTHLFCFVSLRPIISIAQQLPQTLSIDSSLYKDNKTNHYLLLLSGSTEASMQTYNKLCNRLSEYGTLQRVLPATPAYLSEHCETIISSDALHVLSGISQKNK